jgi:anaerobic selenocysteine-containing dehydrogenase
VSSWRTPRTFPFKVLGHRAALADPYPLVRINGDVALIKALLKYMLEEEGKGRRSGIDRTFISKYTEGFETLRKDFVAADWTTLLNATGLSMEHIRSVRDIAASSEYACALLCHV